MIYRRVRSLDKNLIFAEYFNDEQSVRKNGGVPTDVVFDKGVAEFNGSSSTLQINKYDHTKAVRVKVSNITDGASDIVSLKGMIRITLDGGGQYIATIYDGSTITLTGTSGIADGDDIIVTWNGSNGYMYVNGSLVDSAAAGNPLFSSYLDRDYRIGSSYVASSLFYNGGVSLVEFYNKILTAEEVSNLYNNARYVVPNLNRSGLTKILHVMANDGVARNLLSGDTILGELVPEVVNTDIEVVKEGYVRVPRFNGSTSKIDCGDYNSLVGDVSIYGWLFWKAADEGGYGRIVDNSKLLFTTRVSDGYLMLSSDGGTLVHSGTNSLPQDEWVFIGARRKVDGSVTFFIDGEITGSEDQDSGTPVAGTTNLMIGNSDAVDRTLKGDLPEVQVYSGLLTDAEFSQAYSSSKHLYNK